MVGWLQDLHILMQNSIQMQNSHPIQRKNADLLSII